MSLLDQSNALVVVHRQVLGTDTDGNPAWGPEDEGTPLRVMVWPVGDADVVGMSRQPGEAYRVRPARGQPVPVGPWATVEWDGRTWDVHGEITRYQRGRATRRATFVIVSRVKRPGDGGEE